MIVVGKCDEGCNHPCPASSSPVSLIPEPISSSHQSQGPSPVAAILGISAVSSSSAISQSNLDDLATLMFLFIDSTLCGADVANGYNVVGACVGKNSGKPHAPPATILLAGGKSRCGAGIRPASQNRSNQPVVLELLQAPPLISAPVPHSSHQS